jgi:hypothetical protein
MKTIALVASIELIQCEISERITLKWIAADSSARFDVIIVKMIRWYAWNKNKVKKRWYITSNYRSYLSPPRSRTDDRTGSSESCCSLGRRAVLCRDMSAGRKWKSAGYATPLDTCSLSLLNRPLQPREIIIETPQLFIFDRITDRSRVPRNTVMREINDQRQLLNTSCACRDLYEQVIHRRACDSLSRIPMRCSCTRNVQKADNTTRSRTNIIFENESILRTVALCNHARHLRGPINFSVDVGSRSRSCDRFRW